MDLNEELIGDFELGYIHQYKQEVNSIDFTKDGSFLISGCLDNSVRIFSVKNGKCAAELQCRKYGLGLVRSTHSKHYILHSSNNQSNNFAIRYLGLKQVEYLRYFEGHQGDVLSLELSLQSDRFLSSSIDKTVRFWDLRQKNCSGMISTLPRPITAISPKGDVIAVACEINLIRLFNVKQLSRGPFCSVTLSDSPQTFRFIRFSPDGSCILLVSSDYVYILSAFNGSVVWKKEFDLTMLRSADFTPTGNEVVIGSKKAEIYFLNTKNGNQVAKIERTAHLKFISSVACNPRFTHLVSSSTEMNFWIPKIKLIK